MVGAHGIHDEEQDIRGFGAGVKRGGFQFFLMSRPPGATAYVDQSVNQQYRQSHPPEPCSGRTEAQKQGGEEGRDCQSSAARQSHLRQTMPVRWPDYKQAIKGTQCSGKEKRNFGKVPPPAKTTNDKNRDRQC